MKNISPIKLLAVAFIGLWLYILFVPVVTQKEGVVFNLQPGASRSEVVTQLTQQGLIRFSWLFDLYAYLRLDAQLKTGEYLFPYHATPYSIWRQLTTRTGINYRRFTVIPGKTFAQIRETLAHLEGVNQMTAGWEDKKIMALLGQPTLSPEGEFYPETYYYVRDTPDIVLLKRAFDYMQKQLNEAWEKRASNLPYKDKYQALIAASLVEKEAYLDIERPLISGVIVNRLNKNMLLQIDPTVIYGLGSHYDGKIYKKDLLQNTPYNTYMHKGLPPTPIAIPGPVSLQSAMHPSQHDYLYFVAKGNGSHQFSKTLPEHETAVTAIRNKQS